MTIAPSRSRRQGGFTLLEVILALTVCAIALTALFGVIAGSKQLTFRAEGALAEGDELRRLLSLSLLVDPAGELLVPPEDSPYRIRVNSEEIEAPERRTDTSTETLYRYDIENDDGDVVLRGTYWVSLEEAE